MTFTEFFLQQTTKQIKNKFREVGLDKYYNVPESINDFCKMFELENDGKCSHFYVIKRHSGAEVYFSFNLPNPGEPKQPIYFKGEYYITTAKGACSISRSTEQYVDLFEYVSPFFDEREEFNNIEYRAWASTIPGLCDSNYNSYNRRTHYSIKSDKTYWDYYEAVCNVATEVKPLIDMFIQSTENGQFEKVWNSLLPHDKWHKGEEINHAMFFPVIMQDYYRIVKAGAQPNIEDFITFFAAINTISDENRELFEKLTFDNTDKEVMDAFTKIVTAFKQKYIIDDAFKKWNETYSKANKEMLDEINEMRERLSKKYGINKNWLRCVTFFDHKDEISWDGKDVPTDAYITT